MLALGAGCRTASEQFSQHATERGLHADVIMGEGFQHLVLSTPGSRGVTLHVYLDGDGTPTVGGYPAADPTPRDPLVLDLMALDPTPAIYVGRPCYHGLSGAPCSPSLWTSGRYSEPVVASMAAVVRRVVAARGVGRIVWIGYSGGGVLAVLLAARVPETAGVVTIAANLDIDAWTDAQRTPPLTGSLNPARQPPLAPSVSQRHYAGGRDQVVPVQVTRQGAAPGAEVIIVADYDHRCCWATLWPSVLAALERDRGALREYQHPTTTWFRGAPRLRRGRSERRGAWGALPGPPI